MLRNTSALKETRKRKRRGPFPLTAAGRRDTEGAGTPPFAAPKYKTLFLWKAGYSSAHGDHL